MNDKFYSVYSELDDKAIHTKNKFVAEAAYKGIKKGYLSEVTDSGETIICEK